MRRFRPLLALLAVAAVLMRALTRRRDAANIRRLATRLGSSEDDARRVYELSREHGFGAAHEAVFGRREPGRPAATSDSELDDVPSEAADVVAAEPRAEQATELEPAAEAASR